MDAATRQLYELKAEVLAGLAHPLRLAVADFLRNGEQCVCDIARYVGAERSNISRHLAVMHRAGVLDCRKEGLKVLYRLRTPCVLQFLACTTDVLREQAQARQAILAKL